MNDTQYTTLLQAIAQLGMSLEAKIDTIIKIQEEHSATLKEHGILHEEHKAAFEENKLLHKEHKTALKAQNEFLHEFTHNISEFHKEDKREYKNQEKRIVKIERCLKLRTL